MAVKGRWLLVSTQCTFFITAFLSLEQDDTLSRRTINPNKNGGKRTCNLWIHESQGRVGHKGNRLLSYQMPAET